MQRRNTSQSKEFMTSRGFDLPQITVQLESEGGKPRCSKKKTVKRKDLKLV